MVSVVQEEDSSLANVKQFSIEEIVTAPSGLLKIISPEAGTFYTRPEYVDTRLLGFMSAGSVLNDDELDLFIRAVKSYSAELVAFSHLNRSEHSCSQLRLKLLKKGFDDIELGPVLEYLTENNWLNDGRFAEVWLRTRFLHKKEGRARLKAELVLRGIDFETAENALNMFFCENSENDVCDSALEIQMKKGYDKKKLFRTMQRLGFSVKMINNSFSRFMEKIGVNGV